MKQTNLGWLRLLARRRMVHSLGVAVAGATLALALQTTPVHAATITVTTTNPVVNNGDGACSLIEALLNANGDNQSGAVDCAAGNGADTLVLAAGRYTLNAVHNNIDGPNGLPSITGALTLVGQHAMIERANSAPAFRLFHVAATGDLTLQDVTLTGGLAASNKIAARYHYGGALYNQGKVTLIDTTISGNQATLDGGAIANYGDLTVLRSTISGNQAGRDGGGIINNSFTHATTVIMNNCTVSGNAALRAGGGLANFAYRATGQMTLTHCTVTGNHANQSGGGLTTDAPTVLRRSLISGNSAGGSGAEVQRVGHSLTLDAFNLFGHNGQTTAAALSNVTVGASDRLATSDSTTPAALATLVEGTLGDNGGLTWTHDLAANSPAIDLIPTAQCSDMTTDQRGISRPQQAGCDVGAVEFSPSVSISDQLTLSGSPQVAFAREPDPSFGTQSPAGVFTIKATFRNVGPLHLHSIYFLVKRLDNGNYLLDAQGGPGQVDATQLISDTHLPGDDQRWDSQEELVTSFRIGLAERRRFSLRIDIYGMTDTAEQAARSRATSAAIRLGSALFEYDPNDFVTNPTPHNIFLPLLWR